MNNTNNLSRLKREDFQQTVDGKQTDLYILSNKNNVEIAVTNYGAAVLSIIVPDKYGHMSNVIQGHDSIEHLINNPVDVLSTTIYRYDNRISKGKYT